MALWQHGVSGTSGAHSRALLESELTHMPRFDDAELLEAVRQLPGWRVEQNALTKDYRFSTFPDGIAFVNRVADLAEEQGHHPDIDIRYSTVTIRLSTHSEGGVTERDVQLARKIDGMLGR